MNRWKVFGTFMLLPLFFMGLHCTGRYTPVLGSIGFCVMSMVALMMIITGSRKNKVVVIDYLLMLWAASILLPWIIRTLSWTARL